MQIKTESGEQSVASAGVGGSALGLSIGALGLLLLQNRNGLNGLLGGNNVEDQTVVNLQVAQARTEEQIKAINEKAALRDQIIAGKINEVALQTNSAIIATNGRVDCLAQTLSQITQVYVPASSVTPRPMPRFNSFVVPPAPIPPAEAASTTSTTQTNG